MVATVLSIEPASILLSVVYPLSSIKYSPAE
nr:MAG TPA: hypothetical protein [Caudoviricetes sp.]